MAQAAAPNADIGRKQIGKTGKVGVCDECGKVVQAKGLQRHLAVVHGRGKFLSCPHCSKRCASPCDLLKHEKGVHPNCTPSKVPPRRGQLLTEGQTEKSASTSVYHQFQKKDGVYVCEEPGCGKVLSTIKTFRRHRARLHGQGRSYKCAECSTRCITARELQLHQGAVHMKANLSKCDVCGKQFCNKRNMERHRRRIHDKVLPEKPYKCDHCDLTFEKKLRMEDHLAVHSSNRPHSCQICGKTFKTRHSARAHERLVHKLEKTRKCSLCEKRFKTAWEVHDHAKRVHGFKHGKVNDVECPVCKETISTEKILTTHLKLVHGKGKCFQCFYCDTRFLTELGLQRHNLGVHKQLKASVCRECGKSFRMAKDMEIHKKSVHEKLRPFVCPKCKKGFSTKSGLTRHLVNVHAVKKGKIEVEQLVPMTETVAKEDKGMESEDASSATEFWSESLFPSVIITSRQAQHCVHAKPMNSVQLSVSSGEDRSYYCTACGIALGSSNAFKQHNKKFHQMMKLVIPRCTDDTERPDGQVSETESDSDCWVEEYSLGSVVSGQDSEQTALVVMPVGSNSATRSTSRLGMLEGLSPSTCRRPRLVDDIASRLARKLAS